MADFKISKRLCTAASLVRDGAVVADIGTDHAYLPIYLALNGKIKSAIASDINEGPIERAKENIHKYSLENMIQARVAPGLEGIEKFEPTDIVICGMGGELIVKILEASQYVRNKNVRLVLQPMTTAKELREYLQNGFSTIAEKIVFEDNKIYQILCVQYVGDLEPLSEIELELGKLNIQNKEENFDKLLYSAIAKKQKRYEGLKLGGYDTSEIEKEIQELEKLK
ncbi:MAG: SAM-dependent methyltransferase [Clostridia bacterium]|nr:SAM-dependent methyltransferase [Clostridia bacterium]MBP3495317.1 SAM-dependent methyltransferase [Clostridia bacterium]